jgi:ubiquinone/menaquinone biosynthesis C-methylase UbiE
MVIHNKKESVSDGDKGKLKLRVKEYWNKNVCGTSAAEAPKFSREYFDQIEDLRYRAESDIFAFAQFTRYRGQKVLEVGTGSGTDFIQWVRAGAKAYGVDLTEESIEHVRNRLDIYGLAAEEIRVADAENLPYLDNFFDLVYSWGVIHHTPDTIKALEELIRVSRVGGGIKIMVYNRRSLATLSKWLYGGLFAGRPFRSISWILAHSQESAGTKAYTIKEMRSILSGYPVRIKDISARLTKHELQFSNKPLLRFVPYIMACLLGFDKVGWFMTIELEKAEA